MEFKILKFSKPFPMELDVQYTPLHLGEVPVSSLSKSHIRAFPLAIAFKREHHAPLDVSVSSKMDWCLVVPENVRLDKGIEFTNLSLNLDLEALAIEDCQTNENVYRHHQLELDFSLDKQDMSSDGHGQRCSINIPVDIYWFIDIPSDIPGKPQVDKTDIAFDILHLPDPTGKPQEESIQVINAGDARVICDLLGPDWIKADPGRLVLEPGEIKTASITVDPNYVNAGKNFGQIHITNSDININVTLEVIAHGPVPQVDRDISISIPKTDADYTYMFKIVNAGEGELQVSLPINIGDLRYKKTYYVKDELYVPMTIPRNKMDEGETVTRNFNVRSNSIIERLREIPVKFQYRVKPVQEKITEKPKEIFTTGIQKKKEKRNRRAPGIVAVFAVFFLLVTVISSYFMFMRKADEKVNEKVNDSTFRQTSPAKSSLYRQKEDLKKKINPQENKHTEDNLSKTEQDTSPDKLHTTPETSSSNSEGVDEEQEHTDASPVIQSEKLEPPTKPEYFVRLSIYTFPPARIYIDEVEYKDPEGRTVITPARDIRISAGEHEIKIVADNSPNKVWKGKLNFTSDYIFTKDAREGDW